MVSLPTRKRWSKRHRSRHQTQKTPKSLRHVDWTKKIEGDWSEEADEASVTDAEHENDGDEGGEVGGERDGGG